MKMVFGFLMIVAAISGTILLIQSVKDWWDDRKLTRIMAGKCGSKVMGRKVRDEC
jgi:hypothetical protein